MPIKSLPVYVFCSDGYTDDEGQGLHHFVTRDAAVTWINNRIEKRKSTPDCYKVIEGRLLKPLLSVTSLE